MTPIPTPLPDPGDYLVRLVSYLLQVIVTFAIAFALGLVGIKALDKMTPKIREVQAVRGDPMATAMVAGGMLLYSGLVMYGAARSPIPNPSLSAMWGGVGWTLLGFRVAAIVVGFVFTLAVVYAITRFLSEVEPFGIDLDDVNLSSHAVGAFIASYLVFLGLVMLVVLTLPW